MSQRKSSETSEPTEGTHIERLYFELPQDSDLFFTDKNRLRVEPARMELSVRVEDELFPQELLKRLESQLGKEMTELWAGASWRQYTKILMIKKLLGE